METLLQGIRGRDTYLIIEHKFSQLLYLQSESRTVSGMKVSYYLCYDALNEYHNIIQSTLSAAAAGLLKTTQHNARRLERGRK
jgi:hypothetical protein